LFGVDPHCAKLHNHERPAAEVTRTAVVRAVPARASPIKTNARLSVENRAGRCELDQNREDQHNRGGQKKAEMNEEVMALYKKEGVNPLGGCLPMLIQLPFLYGFYRVLSQAVEMRHAAWIWVPDLSVH